MCGIAGLLDLSGRTGRTGLLEIAAKMTDSLAHRGPDGSGHWAEPEVGLALGHRRLSIIDLTDSGFQPMSSNSGRYTLVFNGEIYNFQELKGSLVSDYPYRGRSDTEVILALFEKYGVRAALPHISGMFAISVWDAQERRLTLARDRVGEKPLFYGQDGDFSFFASELKAIQSVPGFVGRIDREALAQYFRFSYVPAPYSIFQQIKKLEPGCFVEMHVGPSQSRWDEPVRYWFPRQIASDGLKAQFEEADDTVIDRLEGLLRGVVRDQMVSDVPLGAFLSGGIDSSLVVALMQAESRAAGGAPVRTFTIGFEDKGYNEAVHAERVARHLGTEHTELYVASAEAMAVIPKLPALYDEPFADSSQIPTYLVAELARRRVTVALSGDAGDELFGGYNRYFWAQKIWDKFKAVPMPVRDWLCRSVRKVPTDTWDSLYRGISPKILPRTLRLRLFGDKLLKFSDVIGFKSPEDIYENLISIWKAKQNPVQGVVAQRWPGEYPRDWEDSSFIDRMMLFDFMTYLPDDILVKVDRAAMGVSLESRVPFLDPRVFEFAWKLPFRFKVREGQSKWILRQVLYRHIPRSLIERPKMGFGNPVGDWLRTDLREWAESLLGKIHDDGILDPEMIQAKWKEHQSGKRNWQADLSVVLMFQAWLEANRGRVILNG